MASKKSKLTMGDVEHIGKLANLPINPQDTEKFATQISSILEYFQSLDEVDVSGVIPTAQVTGLTNVYREDKVDTTRMLSQEEALSNAKHTHNGYFVVDSVLE